MLSILCYTRATLTQRAALAKRDESGGRDERAGLLGAASPTRRRATRSPTNGGRHRMMMMPGTLKRTGVEVV